MDGDSNGNQPTAGGTATGTGGTSGNDSVIKPSQSMPAMRVRPTRKCRVCSDRAYGFNFNVLTCESCKAFFRRSYSRLNDFQCPYEGHCPINIASRKHCAKCRLKKCFTMGMTMDVPKRHRIEDIEDSDEVEENEVDGRNVKEPRRELNAHQPEVNLIGGVDNTKNRETVHTKTTSIDGSQGMVRQDTYLPPDVTTCKNQENDILVTIRLPKSGDLSNEAESGTLNAKLMSIVSSVVGTISKNKNQTEKQPGTTVYQSGVSKVPSHGQLLSEITAGRNRKLALQTGVEASCRLPLLASASYRADDDQPALQRTTSKKSVTASVDLGSQLPSLAGGILPVNVKQAKLTELLMANEEWKTKSKATDRIRGTCAADFCAEDFYTLVYHSYSRAIQQHCRLKGLQKLVFEQSSLLKIRTPELVLIRSVIEYDPTTAETIVQHPSRPRIKDDVLTRMNSQFYDIHKQLKATFPDKFRRNDPLFVVIMALVLFDPDCVTIKQPVELERKIYVELLKDCLNNVPEEKEPRWAYDYIVAWIDYIKLWSKNFGRKTIFEFDPKTFDIKRLVVPKYK